MVADAFLNVGWNRAPVACFVKETIKYFIWIVIQYSAPFNVGSKYDTELSWVGTDLMAPTSSTFIWYIKAWPNGTCKGISCNENVWVLIKISLKFVHVTLSQDWVRQWLSAEQATHHCRKNNDSISLSHKYHNAQVPYPTMNHFVPEMCTFLLQNGALWDMSGALWYLWNGSIH